MMATIINTKIGLSKGRKRVWLEGHKLAREGYLPGMKFDVEVRDNHILLRSSNEGRLTVSRRSRNGVVSPIIDLTVKELAEVFEGVELLRVAISRGKIVISAHHQQQQVKERVDRLLSKLSKGEQLKTASVFHGGGVVDRSIHEGLKHEGIKSKIAVAIERESKYLDSSLRNNPELWDDDSVVIESSVQDVVMDRNPPPVDILVASPPCTGASLAGRSKLKLEFAESHSEAGSTFFGLLQFVQLLNPALVIMENVAAYKDTASMVVIRSVLSNLGYDIHESVLDGVEFGALEKRQRLCVVAVSKGLEGFSFEDVLPVRTKEAQIKDILEDIPQDSNRWKPYDYLADKEKRDKAAGKGFARQLLTGSEGHCGVIGRGYAKARSTEPFIINDVNPELSRLFTPLEHCRVKGIPEQVIAGLSDTTAHEILGQSVIFPVFKAVAKAIGKHLKALCQSKLVLAQQSIKPLGLVA